jgi:hypothetical protein
VRKRKRKKEKEKIISSAPGYITPPFGLVLPSSSDPSSVSW